MSLRVFGSTSQRHACHRRTRTPIGRADRTMAGKGAGTGRGHRSQGCNPGGARRARGKARGKRLWRGAWQLALDIGAQPGPYWRMPAPPPGVPTRMEILTEMHDAIESLRNETNILSAYALAWSEDIGHQVWTQALYHGFVTESARLRVIARVEAIINLIAQVNERVEPEPDHQIVFDALTGPEQVLARQLMAGRRLVVVELRRLRETGFLGVAGPMAGVAGVPAPVVGADTLTAADSSGIVRDV